MTPIKRRRSLNVLAAVDAIREAHPEFARPITITQLRRVLEREAIDIMRRPIPNLAYVEGGLGSFVIVLRAGLNPRHERRVLAHEYAHIKLHYGDVGEVEYQQAPCRRGDPREIEAQLFVRLLELGPDATPDHSEIKRFVAALDAPAIKKPLPAQTELHLPAPAPVFRPASERHPFFSSFDDAAGIRRPYNGPKLRVGMSHDALLFDWSKEGKPLGYFHPHLGWMDIWDTMPAPAQSRRARDVLECGDRRAQWRDFVLSTSDRRRYVFAEGERRGRSPKELNRQIERSVAVRARTPIGPAALFRAKRD